jgi:MFS family permease
MLFKEFTVLLNPQSRKIVTGMCLNAIGGGMTLSLLLVYLHDMRGFTNTFGGLLLSYGAIVSIVASTPMGALVDRIGPKKVMIVGLISNSAAAFSLAFVETHFHAILALTFINISAQAIWPSQSVILTRVTPEVDRPKIFGFNFMLLNLGLGLGGLISSLIIQKGDLRSFQIMYWVDAATFLVYLLIVLSLKGEQVNRYVPTADEPAKGSYRELFTIKPLMYLGIAGIILFTFGYGTIQAGIPIFATQFLGLSPKWLGIIFGVNTISINATNTKNILYGSSRKVTVDPSQITLLRSGNDHNAPMIYVSSPANISKSDRVTMYTDLLRLSGSVIDESGIQQLKVNGTIVPVKENGAYVINLPVNVGENPIVIEAKDLNQNISLKKFIVDRRNQDGT